MGSDDHIDPRNDTVAAILVVISGCVRADYSAVDDTNDSDARIGQFG